MKFTTLRGRVLAGILVRTDSVQFGGVFAIILWRKCREQTFEQPDPSKIKSGTAIAQLYLGLIFCRRGSPYSVELVLTYIL